MRKQLKRIWSNFLPFGVVILLLDVFLQVYFRKIHFGVSNVGVSFGVLGDFGKTASLIVYVLFSLWMMSKVFLKQKIDIYLALIALGGLGNIVGRLVGGSVWDYLYLPFLPFLFNFSDVLISIGVFSYFCSEIATARVQDLQ